MSQNEIFKNYPGEELPRRGPWIGILIIVFIGAFFYSIRLAILAHDTLRAKAAIEVNLTSGVEAAGRLDFLGAETELRKTNEQLSALSSSFEREPFVKFSFSELPQFISDLSKFGTTALHLGTQFLDVFNNGFSWMMSGRGELIIERLRTLETGIANLGVAGAAVKSQSASLGYIVPEKVSGTEGTLFQTEQILKAFVNWLEVPSDRHIALLFQNISEMRPTGGFIGSYGVLTLNRGSVTSFTVDDIYNPDGQLSLKIQPPKPLQEITGTWGARDANWFPDAPTSFAKVLWFLEHSRTYLDTDTMFDAAIALNTDVVADILRITGPITIPEYELEINADNALDAIQREVRSGKDRPTDPKRILKILTPLLFQKLETLDSEAQSKLLELIQYHVHKKNIIVFFKDIVIQNFLKSLGVVGDIAELPQDFSGTYLSVVNTNIASGKTDAVIDQVITLSSTINSSGEVHHELIISRKHNGTDADAWWYRTVNKNYLQILLSPDTSLTSISGNDAVRVRPIIDYSLGTHKIDRDLKAIESSDTMFGKKTVPVWVLTDPGETSTLTFHYKDGRALPLRSGTSYEFVFDKQSGVRGSISFSLKAPPGFFLKDEDNPYLPAKNVFTFTDDDPDSRVWLHVTLVEDPRLP